MISEYFDSSDNFFTVNLLNIGKIVNFGRFGKEIKQIYQNKNFV